MSYELIKNMGQRQQHGTPAMQIQFITLLNFCLVYFVGEKAQAIQFFCSSETSLIYKQALMQKGENGNGTWVVNWWWNDSETPRNQGTMMNPFIVN